MDPESGQMFPGVLMVDGWKLDAACPSEEAPQEWEEPECAASDGESEGVLHAVDPNEVFPSGLRPSSSSSSSSSSSESDSAVSEEPAAVATVTTATAQPTTTTVYQVVYDISGVGGASDEPPGPENVISIELDEWSSRLLLSDSCIVNELPVLPVARPSLSSSSSSSVHLSPDEDLLYPDLQLTEEEQTLLSREGVSLPSNLPLTKAEERILKKVRRKIRNKQSAQDSRRRRKEYIDGLESRAAACSAQNRELQRSVEQLEKHNMSLLAQLRQLQSLIRQTVSKGAQTSTCLLIILVSLGLIILPSFSPFRRHSSEDEDYRPTGVISRNILTDPSSSQPAGGDAPVVGLDSSSPPSDLTQSGPAETSAGLQESTENHQNSTFDSTAPEGGQSGNSSETVARETETAAGKRGRDPKKPGRADEM